MSVEVAVNEGVPPPQPVPEPSPVNQSPAPPPPQVYNPPPAPAAPSASPSASLYVGELDPSVTEAMLFEIFNMLGPVASIRVCRDAVTRRSLGYAYVNYLNASDGERALEQLNYSLIKNRPCRIMWSQRDPHLRKTGQGNIFIKNLDENIDNKALHDTFAAFGAVLSCKVATDEAGRSKGYGFVHYDSAEAADAAIKAVNGMLLNDKKVYVGHHISRKERQSKIDEMKAQFTNLFVKNLDTEISEEELRDIFEPYGQITSCVLQVDEEGKSKGFGFVNYQGHESAQAAVDALHDSEVKGKKLFVSRAQKKAEREEELRRSYEQAKLEKFSQYQGTNLYVKNLDDDWDDEKLRAEFEAFGTITSAKIMRDDKGVSRGFGFVCYTTPDEATRAVSEMNNKMVGSKPLYVSLAQRRDVRRQQLEGQIAQRNQIRMQQAAVANMGGYMNGPMYFPPGPGGYPPQGQRGMMGYPPQPGMMPPRPRYGPSAQPLAGMPVPAPYPPGPQGYPAPSGYPRPPRPSGGPRPADGVPPARAGQTAGTQPAVNGARPPQQGGPLPAGAPANRVPAAGPAGRAQGVNRSSAPIPGAPEGVTVTASALANATPMEAKQMLGEVLFLKIAPTEPELAGKITGMLLEIDNAEVLHLIENQEALNAKVSEAIAVLNEYSNQATAQGEQASA